MNERDPASARRLRVLLTLGVAAGLVVAALAFRLGPSLDPDLGARAPAEPQAAAPGEPGALGAAADGAAAEGAAVDRASPGPARTLYLGSCAGCHGRELGGGVGPALDGSTGTEAPSRDRIREVVRQGHGRMPPIGAAWSDAELDAVATYVRERWRRGAGPDRSGAP